MNDAWATDWLRRFSSSEPTSLLDLYGEGARFEDITLSQRVQGKRKLHVFFADFMNPADRQNSFTLVGYVGDGGGGAIEWTWTARHNADFLNVPARGKETSVRGVSVIRFEGGKIVDQRDYWDARTLVQQLGVNV